MQFLDKNTIKLDKVETELDKLVLDFLNIIKKHTKYVIISGYISILFGRSRAAEDVALFIEKLDKSRLEKLYSDLLKNSYYCLNYDDIQDIFDHLNKKLAVRFAKNEIIIPNFELSFANDLRKIETINNPLKVLIPSGEILTSSIEQQIAYKKYFLKSEKDIEDARHLEKLFEGKLDNNLILYFKRIIENYGRKK